MIENMKTHDALWGKKNSIVINSVKTWVRYVYIIIDYVISKTGLVLQG